jgi:hypothetical protein
MVGRLANLGSITVDGIEHALRQLRRRSFSRHSHLLAVWQRYFVGSPGANLDSVS